MTVKSKKPENKKTLTENPKCDGCGREFKWDPDLSVSLHVVAERPHCETIYLISSKDTKEVLRKLKQSTKKMEAMVKRLGNIPTGISLNFCSVDCLKRGHFGGTVARRKLMEFAKKHLRSGLVYSSYLSVKCKDPMAILWLMGKD